MSGIKPLRDDKVLLSGDLVGFNIDSIGFMVTPSDLEPIPEREEAVSHLRVANAANILVVDSTRCMFRIDSDVGQTTEILFGSNVRLTHVPSEFTLVGSQDVDVGYVHNSHSLRCVYLRGKVEDHDLAHKWTILPRYKLREEGDPVRANDFIFLQNALYKNLCISSFKLPLDSMSSAKMAQFEHLVGLNDITLVQGKPGLQILSLRAQNKAAESEDHSRHLVHSTDCLRIFHRECLGHMICRLDDDKEIKSATTPLGSVCRKLTTPPHNSHGVFVRPLAAQQSQQSRDFATAYSSLGVWQILLAEPFSEFTAHGHIQYGAAVRLRHLFSGQYLAIRPVEPADSAVLRQNALRIHPAEPETPPDLGDYEHNAAMSDFANDILKKAATPLKPDLSLTQNIPFRLSVKDVIAKDMKNLDWVGHPSIFLQLSYGSGKGPAPKWAAETSAIKTSHNNDIIQWNYNKQTNSSEADEMSFVTTTEEMSSCLLRVVAMDKKTLFRDTVIGGGGVNLLNAQSALIKGEGQVAAHELIDVQVQILDKDKRPAGLVIIILMKEAIRSSPRASILSSALSAATETRTFGFTTKKKTSPPQLEDPDGSNKKLHIEVDDMEAAALPRHVTSKPKAEKKGPVDWTIGTSTEPNANTVFLIRAMDALNDSAPAHYQYISYGERLVLEHLETRFSMKMSPPPLLSAVQKEDEKWWQYRADAAFMPASREGERVIDAEVCQMEKVTPEEVQDILYCRRFLPITRAATASLQLTPRPGQLYLPLFRHFCCSLQTLVLWTVGSNRNDATLCDVRTTQDNLGQQTIQELANRLDGAEDEEEEEDEEGFGEDHSNTYSESEEGAAAVGRIARDTPPDDGFESSAVGTAGAGIEMSSTLNNNNNNNQYTKLDMRDSMKRFNTIMAPMSSQVEVPTDGGLHTFPTVVDRSVSSEKPRISAMSPWLGRVLEAGLETHSVSHLSNYSASLLRRALDSEMVTNEVMARRQNILHDSRIVELLMHFLEIFFILSRALSLSPVRVKKSLEGAIPAVVRHCCSHIQDALHAILYRNEYVALKMITIQGSFVSMISQRIIGWNSPIETILRLVCSDGVTKADHDPQVDILSGHLLLNRWGSHSKARDEADAKAKAASAAAAAGQKNLESSFAVTANDINIEALFMNAITASDIRQIVAQMHELHLSGDTEGALNILQLLTLLCSAGKAKKYFQDMLINSIVIPTEIRNHMIVSKYRKKGDRTDSYETLTDAAEMDENSVASTVQTNCMLFYTRYYQAEWQVKFRSVFSFPSPDAIDKSAYKEKLKQEALNLRLLFSQYDTEIGTDDYLDITECFWLLEDLGLAGTFLYEEIRHLEGSNIYSFMNWWCYRCSYYLPSSGISHCQLSPVQIMDLICIPLGPDLLQAHNDKKQHDLDTIFDQLDYVTIINTRVPGFLLRLDSEIAYAHKLDKTSPRSTPNTPQTPKFHISLSVNDINKRTPRSRAVRRNDWQSVGAALAHSNSEADWFRKSLILLTEICKGCNTYSQRQANIVMPAECLLSMLKDDQMGTEDKHIASELLISVYINNDFVFPVNMAPAFSSTMYCGHNESLTSHSQAGRPKDGTSGIHSFAVGEVFNPLSRVRYESEGGLDDKMLRASLYRYVTSEVTHLDLYSPDKQSQLYINSVFRLLKLLLAKGFFNDVDFEFFADPNENSRKLSVNSLHDILVDKLLETMVIYRAASEAEGITSPGVTSKAASVHHESVRSSTTAVVRFEKDNEVDFDFSKRKNMTHIGGVLRMFEAIFADSKLVSIYDNVVSILVTLHDIKQLVRIQNAWNYISDTVKDLSSELQDNLHVKSLETAPIDYTSVNKNLRSYFVEPVDARTQCEALLSATLLSDMQLKKKCYDLLNRQLCLSKDCSAIFDSVNCCKSANRAVSYRLIVVYSEILVKCVAEVLKQPLPMKTLILEKIKYCVDHIKEMCVHPEKNLEDRSNLPTGSRKYLSSTSAMIRAGRKSSTSLLSGLLLGNKEEVVNRFRADRELCTHVYLSSAVQCPGGDDDFFEFELKKLHNSADDTSSVFEYYSSHNQFIGDFTLHYERSIPMEKHVSAFCAELIRMMTVNAEVVIISYTSQFNTIYRPWSSFTQSEMFLYDTVLELLAYLGHNSQSLCVQWFPALASLLSKFTPYCRGACSLVNVFIVQLAGTQAAHSKNLREVTSQDEEPLTYVGWVSEMVVKVTGMIAVSSLRQHVTGQMLSELLCAVMRSNHQGLVELAVKSIFEEKSLIFNQYNIRSAPDPLYNNVSLRHDLYFAINPFCHMLTHKVHMSRSEQDAMLILFPLDLCLSYIQSPHTPLVIKTRYIQASLALHSTSPALQLEKSLIKDLRHLRMFFSLYQPKPRVNRNNALIPPSFGAPLSSQPCIRSVVEFLGHGVIKYLWFKMSGSEKKITSRINDYVVDQIDSIAAYGIIGGKKQKHEHYALKDIYSSYKSRFNNKEDESTTEDRALTVWSTECVHCLLLLLNVLALNDSFLLHALSSDSQHHLICLVAGATMLMEEHKRSFSIFEVHDQSDTFGDMAPAAAPSAGPSKKAGVGLSDENFRMKTIRRLYEYLHGLLCNQLSPLIDESIYIYLCKKLISNTQKELSEVKNVVSPGQRAKHVFLGKTEGGKSERATFLHDMELNKVFSLEYLENTQLFRLIRHSLHTAAKFHDLGGGLMIADPNCTQAKNKSYAMKFSEYSNFDVYMHGQGKHIINLLLYLGQVTHPTQTEFTLVHILCGLLDNNIEQIRHSTLLSLNIKLTLIDVETKRLQKVQNSLNLVGGLQFVVKALGRSFTQHEDNFTYIYAPLAMKFGTAMMSWKNKPLQDFMIDAIDSAITLNKPPGTDSLLGLQFVIRRCNMDLIKLSNRNPRDQVKVLKTLTMVFDLVGVLCLGDNSKAQKFLTGNSLKSGKVVDIIDELCVLANTVLTRFTGSLKYIENDLFYEKLSPPVWIGKDPAKRRYLAWHDPANRNVYLMTQYLHAIAVMFVNLVTMCCKESNSAVLSALPRCPQLLEFLGLMQLKASTKLSDSGTGNRTVSFSGGNPFSFYKKYVNELTQLSSMESDPDYDIIKTSLREWRGKQSQQKQIELEAVDPTLSGRYMIENSKKAKRLASHFKLIFGISHDLFMWYVRDTEYKCLRLILSYLEFGSTSQSENLAKYFSDSILIQNMDNIFRRIGWSFGELKDTYCCTTVAYISLIENIGTHFPETNQLLTAWDQDSVDQGYKPKALYGSVEIVTSDGRLQRLYFPVPAFVKKYWDYPEVQKVKDLIVHEVNRNSPEEKIADFLTQMARIATVMRRQERLRIYLTPFIHALLGGKTTSFAGYFPKQRVMALTLTLFFNIYYVYFSSLSHPYHPAKTSAFYDYFKWSAQEQFIFILQYLHFALNASAALRTLVNSAAADAMNRYYDGISNKVLKSVVKALCVPLGLLYICLDSAWPIALAAMAYGAIVYSVWLYVPCLIDVMFQLNDMYFLYLAITRNFSRIGFTLLLAFLILYFFSVLIFLFVGGQYQLNNLDAPCGNNLVACFKFHLDYGLNNSPSWNSPSYIAPNLPIHFVYSVLLSNVLGTVYNLIYVILINLVLQAIISGLIIDTFSTMREENEKVAADIGDKCFICSILRDDFEQAGVPYQEHIKDEHNMWHYVWFKLYLELKDPVSYSSSENYAYQCMQDKQTFLKLMPIKRSFSLEQKLGEVEVEKLEVKLESLVRSLKDLHLTQKKIITHVKHLAESHVTMDSRIQEMMQQWEEKE